MAKAVMVAGVEAMGEKMALMAVLGVVAAVMEVVTRKITMLGAGMPGNEWEIRNGLEWEWPE